MPFYAGWGLTNDFITQKRREKKLNLNELIAATLILYPKYINPFSLLPCTPEHLLIELEKEKKMYDNSLVYRIKIKFRNFISRKLQLFLRIITLKF